MNDHQAQAGLEVFSNLDMSFSKLPQELQEKSVTLNKALRRTTKARKQYDLWRIENNIADQALRVAQDDHADALNRWDPDTNQITDPVELLEKP